MTERVRITCQVAGAVVVSATFALLLDHSGVLRNGFPVMFVNLLVLLLAVVAGTWWRRRQGSSGAPARRAPRPRRRGRPAPDLAGSTRDPGDHD